MTRVIFKYDKLNRDVVPNIRSVVDELYNLKLYIEKMIVPNDFKYFNYYNNICDTIDNWIINYLNLLDKIKKINADLTYNKIDIEMLNKDLNE